MAEGFLRARLRRRLGARAPRVVSVGLIARTGDPAEPEAIRAAAERGVDISGHASTRITLDAIERADLVVGMAAEHRDRIVEASPEARSKTFTLKELVRLLGRSGSDPVEGADPAPVLAERVRAAAERRLDPARGVLVDEDVRDPLGLSLSAFRSIAAELDDLCSLLVERLFGVVEPSTAHGGGA